MWGRGFVRSQRRSGKGRGSEGGGFTAQPRPGGGVLSLPWQQQVRSASSSATIWPDRRSPSLTALVSPPHPGLTPRPLPPPAGVTSPLHESELQKNHILTFCSFSSSEFTSATLPSLLLFFHSLSCQELNDTAELAHRYGNRFVIGPRERLERLWVGAPSAG